MAKPIISGIYTITHKESGSVYVGSSKDVAHRWMMHRCLLKSRKHHNKHLESAWAKYGAESFVFEIVHQCVGRQVLIDNEQIWIDALAKTSTLYNAFLIVRLPYVASEHGQKLQKECATCLRVFDVPRNEKKRIFCSTSCANKRQIKPKPKVICAHCSRLFSMKDYVTNRTFCSHECRVAHKRAALTKCPVCANTFVGKKRKQVHCSTACQAIGHRNSITHNCEHCGTAYKVQASKVHRSRFCSKSCRSKTIMQNRLLAKKQSTLAVHPALF